MAELIYDGPENMHDYYAWLKSKYGEVAERFLPATIVAWHRNYWMVVGYAFQDDLPTIKVIEAIADESGELTAIDVKGTIAKIDGTREGIFTVCPVHELEFVTVLHKFEKWRDGGLSLGEEVEAGVVL